MKTPKIITVIISSIFLETYVRAQGNLIPSGAPVPMMKTLEQVEPRTDVMTLSGDASSEIVITNSGSYYLTRNLEVIKPIGISINAAGVTLDLSGFKIVRISGNGECGIKIDLNMDRSTVRNGTITGFDYGVYAPSAGGLFEKLSVSGCRVLGINAGAISRVTDCRANNNSGSGIFAAWGSIVSGCTASGNQGDVGIQTHFGSFITDCTVSSNQCVSGIYAVNSSIKNCDAFNNVGTASSSAGIFGHASSIIESSACNNIGYDSSSSGIHGTGGSIIRECVAANNQSSGIRAGDGSFISKCTAYGNQGDAGILTDRGVTIIGCDAYNNMGLGSSSYGIYAGSGSSVIACTARANGNTNSPASASQGIGIAAIHGSSVRGCSATGNKGDGIRVDKFCYVKENLCSNNGDAGDGAGIHSTSSGNQIEGNTVTENDRGIDVDSFGSSIIRNTATLNAINYEIANANKMGTIITPPNSTAISGDTGGAGVGSTDPWANFSF